MDAPKLANFPRQKHIVSVLRAAIIRNEAPELVCLLGGDKEEAAQLGEAYIKAANCKNPQQGDSCGACFTCVNPQVRNGEHRVKLGYDAYANLVFELNPPATSQTPEYKKAVGVFLRCARSSIKETLVSSEEYAETYSYKTLVNMLTELLRDILALKHGAAVAESNQAVDLLASTVPHPKLISCLKILWESQHTVITAEDAVAAQTLALLLADILNPLDSYVFTAGINETPISTIEVPEQTPLSIEEMESLAQS